MKVVDITPLMALPDEAFIDQAWCSFMADASQAPSSVVLGLHAGESRTLVLVRAWIAARARDPSLGPLRLAGPGTRALNLATRWPAGLQVLRIALQVMGHLTGRRRQRLALKAHEIALRLAHTEARLTHTEARLAQIEQQALLTQTRLEAQIRDLSQTVEQKINHGLADDLTRRVDLMAFEMRQAVDAAALAVQERQTLADAADAAARRLRP